MRLSHKYMFKVFPRRVWKGDLLWGDKGKDWGSLVGKGVSVREVAVVDVLTHSSEDVVSTLGWVWVL